MKVWPNCRAKIVIGLFEYYYKKGESGSSGGDRHLFFLPPDEGRPELCRYNGSFSSGAERQRIREFTPGILTVLQFSWKEGSMMVNCERCGARIDTVNSYTYFGQTLCEDCYMDVLNPPRPCDPWATYTATHTMSGPEVLTPLQQRILSILRKRPMTSEELTRLLHIQERVLKREFATLHHMEKVKAVKKDDKVYLTAC